MIEKEKEEEAIKGSIKKWEAIVKSTKALDEGSFNCPLCRLYTYCDDCPVGKKTGEGSCVGTPYTAWNIHLYGDHYKTGDRHRVPGCKTCLSIARDEVTFLKSLL